MTKWNLPGGTKLSKATAQGERVFAHYVATPTLNATVKLPQDCNYSTLMALVAYCRANDIGPAKLNPTGETSTLAKRATVVLP